MESSTSSSILSGPITIEKNNFFSLLNQSVIQNINKLAIIYEDGIGQEYRITYKEMNEISNNIAKLLKRYYKNEETNEQIIAVSLKPSDKIPILLLAIMKAGFSYLPIAVDFPEDRIRYILQDAQPVLCITDEEAQASTYSNVETITDKQLFSSAHIGLESVDKNIENNNVALILYTSGSTGTPKGVRLPYSAVLNRLSWQWKELPYGLDERFCIFKTALTFVDSVCEVWGPLLQGRTLIVVPNHITKNPEKFVEILEKYKIQRIVLVPSLLKVLLTHLQLQITKENLTALTLWICSGETLSYLLVKEFFSCFPGKNKIIANFYGSTEIMGDVTYILMKESNWNLYGSKIPIGKPVDNCTIYIVDKHLNIVPQGEVGEMLVAGKNVTIGYLHHKESFKFIENPFSSEEGLQNVFRTGDYARIVNNLLFFEGRKDSQIKIRGNRVDLSEIEKTVLEMPFVLDCAIICDTIKDAEQMILSFLVLKQNNLNIESNHIKELLKQKLPSYMIPQIIILDSLPLLINGKVDRQELLSTYKISSSKKFHEEVSFNLKDVPSQCRDKAKKLFHTITQVISLQNHSEINIHSNFYELGGNSLNSVFTVLKLREMGLHISITDFITAKTMLDILFKLKVDALSNVNDEYIDSNLYVFEILNDTHKNEVINMITESFINKADLERWLLPDIKKEDYFELLQELWKHLVEKKLSFIIKSASDDIVLSVSLNFDALDEPDVIINSKLSIIFDFLEYIEKPVREEQLPKEKNKIFHTFMMATSDKLSAKDNVIMMKLMEEKCLNIAKVNNFVGILTTNTSPLTQQLGIDIFKYEVLLDYQVNQYTTSIGEKPFGKAPDDQRAIVCWKKINC